MIAAFLFCLATSSPSQWTLKDGSRVSVLMVNPTKKLAWQLNGDPIGFATVPKVRFPNPRGEITGTELEVVIRSAQRSWVMPNVQFRLPSGYQFAAGYTGLSQSRGENVWISCDTFLHCGEPLFFGPGGYDIEIGIANGPWKDSHWATFGNVNGKRQLKTFGGESFRPGMAGSRSSNGRALTTVTLPSFKNTDKHLVHLVVKAQDGSNMECASTEDRNAISRCIFLGDIHSVTRIELQSRYIQWHSVHVGNLKPNP